MNIFLIGYMGSGKSSVGKILAKTLNYNFIDFDEYIEEKENKSISQIFKVNGEIYFRRAEHNYLKHLNLSNTIISLGGGTPCYGNNMDIIQSYKNSKRIYLKTSIANLSQRLYVEKSKRPLIAHLETKDELNEFIGKHLFERSVFYNRCDTTILTDGKSIPEIVEAIIVDLY